MSKEYTYWYRGFDGSHQSINLPQKYNLKNAKSVQNLAKIIAKHEQEPWHSRVVVMIYASETGPIVAIAPVLISTVTTYEVGAVEIVEGGGK